MANNQKIQPGFLPLLLFLDSTPHTPGKLHTIPPTTLFWTYPIVFLISGLTYLAHCGALLSDGHGHCECLPEHLAPAIQRLEQITEWKSISWFVLKVSDLSHTQGLESCYNIRRVYIIVKILKGSMWMQWETNMIKFTWLN